MNLGGVKYPTTLLKESLVMLFLHGFGHLKGSLKHKNKSIIHIS